MPFPRAAQTRTPFLHSPGYQNGFLIYAVKGELHTVRLRHSDQLQEWFFYYMTLNQMSYKVVSVERL